MNWEAGSHQTPNLLVPWARISSPNYCKKCTTVVDELPNLWQCWYNRKDKTNTRNKLNKLQTFQVFLFLLSYYTFLFLLKSVPIISAFQSVCLFHLSCRNYWYKDYHNFKMSFLMSTRISREATLLLLMLVLYLFSTLFIFFS